MGTNGKARSVRSVGEVQRSAGVESDPMVLAVRFVEHAIEALATARRHAVVLGTELGGEWELLGRARELCRDVLPELQAAAVRVA